MVYDNSELLVDLGCFHIWAPGAVKELRVRVHHEAESPRECHYRWLSSMTKHIDIGDPPVSSLASCLRSFPGGFSLLTETAQLRAFFVGDDTPGSVSVVAKSLVELCPSLRGSFPLDKEIPVDHAWSEDGVLLTLLYRGGFKVYSRPDGLSMDATLAQSKDVGELATPDENSTSASAEPTLWGERILDVGLDLRCSGTNSFEGKVVLCISSSATCRTATGGRSSTEDNDRRANGNDRDSYVIAVGGSFGIECHWLEIDFRRGDRSSGQSPASVRPDSNRTCGVEAGADRPSQCPTGSVNHMDDGEKTTCGTVACRSYTTLFGGYPVVSMEYSPKADLLAAAAMTGHVKVWDVSTIRDQAFLPAAPEVPSITPPPKSRRHSTGSVRGRGSGRSKGKGKGDESRKERSQRRKKRPQERRVSLEVMFAPPAMPRSAEAMWSFSLDAARATSLAFTSDGSGTLALGCWDGRVLIFLPCSTDTTDVIADADKCVAETATAIDPADGSDGMMQGETCTRAWKPMWRENPEDDKMAGTPRGGDHFEDSDGTFVSWCGGRGQSPGFGLVISSCRDAGFFRYSRPDDGSTSSLLGLSHGVHGGTGPIDHLSGPGFGIFEEGLGKQIGGLLTRRGPGRRKLKTAERYSIHGMVVTSASFVALYDSDLCLHVVSLSEATKTGGILAPRARSAASQADSTILSRIRQLQELLAVTHEGHEVYDDLTGSKSSSGTGRVVLANNDHGLVVSEPEHKDLDEYDGTFDRKAGRLKLTILWRDAATGRESPDDGACSGGTANGGLLSFLPDHGEPGGLLTADIRRGRIALFSTYVVVVYERPDIAKASLKAATQTNIGDEDAAGKWRAYPGGPNIHGLLIGGPSTAMPVSPKLPKAPADLAQEYLLVVQGSIEENGEARVVTVRSLSDRRVSFECPVTEHTTGRDKKNRMRVYVSPGYSGGVFVVALADDEDTRTCATIWRGSFDEAKPRVVLGSSKVVTTWPWPEPATLRLAGVSGPNCELILFKEKVALASASGDPEDAETERVRWWITWPELAIWRFVDAPRRLGGEELGVGDFVKVYQQLLESMLTAHNP